MTMLTHTELFVKLVTEFNRVFELPHFVHPDFAPFDVHRLRAKLIEESLAAFHRAAGDEALLIALCDLIYAITSTAVTYSTPVAPYTSHAREGSVLVIAPLVKLITNDLHTLFPCQNMLTVGINKSLAALDDFASIRGYDTEGAFMAVHINKMGGKFAAHTKVKLEPFIAHV
jgi:hypothetical protein